MSREAIGRLIVALDFDDLTFAYTMARQLVGFAGMFKIGSQLFAAEGPRAVEKLGGLGPGIFLDLKFHDIPSTVAGAISGGASLPGVSLIDVHALGGFEMMRAARGALGDNLWRARKRPRVLAVTVLTSMDAAALRRVGIGGPPRSRAVKLALLAKQAGLDGAVVSAHEVTPIRRTCGKGFLIVVPGVRPRGVGRIRGDDQARVATPGEAIRAGADYVVVGRPITAARDPCAAAAAILEEVAQAQRDRIDAPLALR
ncbi:MAG TPA: orotidine-5'-phosphate decarboxylase [Candidatus Acidoferrales bacterium]|nr:orotidine-5'-phosphate decarboxylase [Candidatus Acidoferrales bacterium]